MWTTWWDICAWRVSENKLGINWAGIPEQEYDLLGLRLPRPARPCLFRLTKTTWSLTMSLNSHLSFVGKARLNYRYRLG